MTIEAFHKALQVLDSTPPSFTPDREREEAFLQISRFLESATRAGQPFDLRTNPDPVWQIVAQRMRDALNKLSATAPPSAGVTLVQLYNCGIIIKTPTLVMGFDLITKPLFMEAGAPASLAQELAATIDVLFITHRHTDHYDEHVVDACLQAQKPVVMPRALSLRYPDAGGAEGVRDGWQRDFHGASVTGRSGYHVWKDTLDDLPLVYYEVACDNGFTFIFGGDVDYTKAFEKTPDRRIDAFFIPWRNPNALYEDGQPGQIGSTLDAVRIALERVQPARLVYEHYAELEHVYDGFSPSYELAFRLQREIGIPSELLFWGESVGIS